MSIKTFKPTTPSRRHMTVSGFDGIDKHAKPEASLTEVLKKNAGRNSYGHITVRHRGGGEKRKYRIIDFKRDKVDMEATVLRLEYDPNRSANIALVGELVQRTEAEMLKTKNFGRKSLDEIKSVLLDMGLDFGLKVDNFDKKYQDWKRKQQNEA